MDDQRISLSKSKLGHDIFLDQFLRDARSIKSGKINVDISEFLWANDFQLSVFPFIISHLSKNKKIIIEYPLENLFPQDDFFNYLYASGFFDFMKNHGIEVQKGKLGFDENMEFNHFQRFQSFKNIAKITEIGEDPKESRKLLYELSSNLRAFFQKEIFQYTYTAEKLTRVIAKELIENINQHSEANLALARFRYIKGYDEIKKIYGNIQVLSNYLEDHQNTNLFILTISDNGKGMIKTLKEKYENGQFVSEKETLTETLQNPNTWWLQKAFEEHKSSHEDIRSRMGLKAVLDVISEYNGFFYLRCDNAAVYYDKHMGKPMDLKSSLYHPEIGGTHYIIIFPAEYKKKTTFINCNLYQKDKVETITETSQLHYVEFDISYKTSISAISPSIEVSYNYPQEMLEEISKKLDAVISHGNQILVIDFSNALYEKAIDYAFILEQVTRKYQDKVGKYCILRNVADDIILTFRKSRLTRLLNQCQGFILIFNILDNFSILGIIDANIEKDLMKLFRNTFLKTSELKNETIDLIEKNNYLVRTAFLFSDRIAFYVDFHLIFQSEFKKKVREQIESSGALIEGHFYIPENRHADNYLIAPLVFQDPSLCRVFAKKIFQKYQNKPIDVLLTYSTTGIIMYFYLKNYYMPGLQLMLINGPSDLEIKYGQNIKKNQNVLILTDVKATGTFIDRLRTKAIKMSGSEENIAGQCAIFDLNTNFKSDSYDIETLYDDLQIPIKFSNECPCRDNKTFIAYDATLNIDATTGIPTVYNKDASTLSVLLNKRKLLKNIEKVVDKRIEHEDFRSRIDDEKMSIFELYEYWKSLEQVFQIEHIKRGDTHFKHYDISERLLFKDETLIELEAYIKQFIWSFRKEVHFVIYPRDLTAAFLGHIVATRFLKKPTVIEARKLQDGSLILPLAIATHLKDKNVLLVDDAINTGKSMFELIGLINMYGGIVSGILTITSRTSPEVEMTLRTLVPKVACAYRFNLDVFSQDKCDLCKYNIILDENLIAAATKEFSIHLQDKRSQNEVKQFETG